MHFQRAGFRLVFESQKMQDAVNRQQGELPIERYSVLLRLSNGGVHRDHHVSEHLRFAGKRGRARHAFHMITLCEGEDVRRFVVSAILEVQGVHRRIIRQQDIHLGGRQVCLAEEPARRLSQLFCANRARLFVRQRDWHTGPH